MIGYSPPVRRTLATCLFLSAALPLTAMAETPVIAVFDIEDTSHAKKRFDKQLLVQLAAYLEGQLAEGSAYRVVPRDALRKELKGAKKTTYVRLRPR